MRAASASAPSRGWTGFVASTSAARRTTASRSSVASATWRPIHRSGSSHSGGSPSDRTTSPSSRALGAMRSHRPRREAPMASSPTTSSENRSAGWRSSTPSARFQASPRRARSPDRRANPASIAAAVSTSRGRQRLGSDLVERLLGGGPAAAAHRHPPEAEPVVGGEGGPADCVVAGPGQQVLGGGQLAEGERHGGADGVRAGRQHQGRVRRLEQLGRLEHGGKGPTAVGRDRRHQRVAREAERLDLEARRRVVRVGPCRRPATVLRRGGRAPGRPWRSCRRGQQRPGGAARVGRGGRRSGRPRRRAGQLAVGRRPSGATARGPAAGRRRPPGPARARPLRPRPSRRRPGGAPSRRRR